MGATRRRPARRPGSSGVVTFEGWLLAALGAAVVVVFWRPADTIFAGPKLAVAVVLVVALLIARIGAGRGRASPTWSPLVWATVAFVVAAGLATLTSDAPMLSLVGHHGRSSGLVLYLVGAVVLLLVAGTPSPTVERHVLSGVGVGAVTMAVYAWLQWLGADPVGWGTRVVDVQGVTSTVGNPNFVAAHGAIGLGLGVGLATIPSRGERIAGGVVAVLCGGAILAARSYQGYVAGLAALGIVGAAVAVRRWPRHRRRLGMGVGVSTLVGVGVLVAGVTGRGPLSLLEGRAGVDYRLWNWRAALSMVAERPLLGVGFDRYGAHAHAHRPPEAADVLGPEVALGAAHNVPLHLLSAGGVLLGATYIAVVVVVGWALVSGLARLDGQRHRLLAAAGAAWVAYQVQSLVSLDVPSLLVTHALLAGAVVVLAGPPARLVPAARVIPGSSRIRPTVLGAGALAIMGLLLVPTGRLLVADVAAGSGERARGAGDLDGAVSALDRATTLAGWEPRWWERLGITHGAREDGAAAREALTAGVEADPRALSPRLNLARLTVALGDAVAASEHYRVVLDLEPHHVGLHREAAEAITQAEGTGPALTVGEALVERRPRSGAAWELLADQREQDGDRAGAEAARERAAALPPSGAADG